MAGSQFQTSVPTMQQASSQVEQVQASLNSLLNGYWSRNEPIIGGASWKGAGQSSFASLAAEWNSGFQKINQALEAIGQQIQTSGVTYDTSDETTQQSFGALQGFVV